MFFAFAPLLRFAHAFLWRLRPAEGRVERILRANPDLVHELE